MEKSRKWAGENQVPKQNLNGQARTHGLCARAERFVVLPQTGNQNKIVEIYHVN
jgi:hypothetical protein